MERARSYEEAHTRGTVRVPVLRKRGRTVPDAEVPVRETHICGPVELADVVVDDYLTEAGVRHLLRWMDGWMTTRAGVQQESTG